MLECRACVLRCIRAIAKDPAPRIAARRTTLLLTPQLSARPQHRRLATAAAQQQVALPTEDPKRTDSSVAPSHSDRQLRTELTYLKDPLKFADHVHYTLRQKKPEKALDLCRLASKSTSCVVAWNHVIDWMMKSGRANAALKVFNEMKKRGQYPDSFTYTILLRGFSIRGTNEDSEGTERILKQNVVKAVSVYTSMTSPTSRVKPSIIHTNAVLQVCSLARDMDALWNVASKIPQHGSGAADHATYSILLCAIRYGAFGEYGDDHESGMPVERIAQARQQAVNEGRRIWQEVVEKWRGGEVLIDQGLVVNMANLLLLGRRMEDWDDVLNLIRQTTNLERPVEPLGSAKRRIGHVPQPDEVDPQTTPTEDSEGWVPTPAANAFKIAIPLKADSERTRGTNRLAYVQPGNGILSVLIQACTYMRVPQAAYAYWHKLVNDYQVIPDRRNFKELLRLMYYNRASNKAVELVQDMHARHNITPYYTTYRLAVKVLERDWKNRNVIDCAIALLDDMDKHLDQPDDRVLCEILSLTRKANNNEQTLRIVDRMQEIMPKLLSGDEVETRYIAVLKSIVSTIDTAVAEGGLSPSDTERMDSLRSSVNGFIGQAMNPFPVKPRGLGPKETSKGENGDTVLSANTRRHLARSLGSESRHARSMKTELRS